MSAAADFCTLLRILLAPLFAWQLAEAARAPSAVPLALYTLAIATDFADGRLARAGGRLDRRGRLFDHGADILFLLPGLVVLAALDRLPALLPWTAALAFALYCGDGWRRGRAAGVIDLAPSERGTVAGLANYAVAGAAAGALWIGDGVLDAVTYGAAIAAAALNAAAALERTQALLRWTLPGAGARGAQVPPT